MPARITRLDHHRKAVQRHVARVQDLAQLALGLDISDGAKAEIAHAAHRLEQEATPEPEWTFVKLHGPAYRHIVRLIHSHLPKPDLTTRIFSMACTYAKNGTNEVMANRRRLAEDAMTTPDEVSRAMSALVDLGAMTREVRGRRPVYSINPDVVWAGTETQRQAAVARGAPRLQVVEG